jgi:hypothetical protein
LSNEKSTQDNKHPLCHLARHLAHAAFSRAGLGLANHQAFLCTHIPDAGQPLVRYCGAFSNMRRTGAHRAGSAHAKEPDGPESRAQHPGCAHDFARRLRRSSARLIKKVYEADPLVCPHCGGPLKIISLIDSAAVIERILRHLKRWDCPERPPPRAPERSLHYEPEVAVFDDVSQSPDPSE